MNFFTSYTFIIGASLIIIISYLFNRLSKNTGIPSVLMLIILGLIIKESMELYHATEINFLPILEIVGIVGLIIIVLEAALDLELDRKKLLIIWKSILLALLSVLFASISIAFLFQFFIDLSFSIALLYALPLSIMSSAIVIPSIENLEHDKKEFLIYESTFSDILGIMLFYFLIGSFETESSIEIVSNISISILLTIVISIIVSYLLIIIFQKLHGETTLFLLIAVLILLYSISKEFHLSSLLIILVFGLFLRNPTIFFRGKLKHFLHEKSFAKVYKNFKLITIESSFIIRTFFFVIFGITITLSSLWNLEVIGISLIIVLFLFGSRFVLMKLILKKDICPQIFIAPRGLITILLFYSIPEKFQTNKFNTGILLFTIIITSLVMTFALIRKKSKNKNLNLTKKVQIMDKKKHSK